jgi:dCTP deaminase
MAFWSGEKLARHLPSLVHGFDPKNIDCASYRLCVGDQVFATSDKFVTSSATDPIVSVLSKAPNHTLRIKPGQFAFLMTKESVKVPNDAIALISMRAGYKFKGLINVSGFHVDPGWEGQLLFSIYNAGPAEVIVERGEAMFLIVFSDLDRMSSMVYSGSSKGQRDIKTSLLQNMTEQVFSPLMLQRRIEDLVEKVRAVESTANTWKIVTIAVSSVIGILLAAAAIFATFAPATLGVIFAKIVETGGYELKQKSDESPQRRDGTPPVAPEGKQPEAKSKK